MKILQKNGEIYDQFMENNGLLGKQKIEKYSIK
jgi:hypothetical protein